MTTPTDAQIQEATKLYQSLLNDGYRDGQGITDLARLIAARDENVELMRQDKTACPHPFDKIEAAGPQYQWCGVCGSIRRVNDSLDEHPIVFMDWLIPDAAMNKEKK